MPNYFDLLDLPLIVSRDRIKQGKRRPFEEWTILIPLLKGYLSLALAFHPDLLDLRHNPTHQEEKSKHFCRLAQAYLVLISRGRRRNHRRRLREHLGRFSNAFEPFETLERAHEVFDDVMDDLYCLLVKGKSRRFLLRCTSP
jgi:curved DNA-binding protein CbpA